MLWLNNIKKRIKKYCHQKELKEYTLSKHKVYFTTLDGEEHESAFNCWVVFPSEYSMETRLLHIVDDLYRNYLIEKDKITFYHPKNIIGITPKITAVQNRTLKIIEKRYITDEELHQIILETGEI